MTGSIHRVSESDEYYFKEGCHILEWQNSARDPDVSVARARVEPGMQTRKHRLRGTSERYLILQGQGEVFIGDLPPQKVIPGTVVVIDPDTDQSIRNTGTEDLVFLVVCTPRFVPECYLDTENC